MEDKDISLAQINEKMIDFLHDRGFSCEVIENHGIVASFGNSTLLLSPRTDGCFAAKATTLSRDKVLAMYKTDTQGSLESDRQIGWWAYKNKNLPYSGLLDIRNHDISIGKIQSAVDDMINMNLSLEKEINQRNCNRKEVERLKNPLYEKVSVATSLQEFKVNLDQTEWYYKDIKGQIHYSDIQHSEGRRLISTAGVALYPDEFHLALKGIDDARIAKNLSEHGTISKIAAEMESSKTHMVILSKESTEVLLSLRKQLSSAIDEIDAVVGKNGQVQQNISTHERQANEINQNRKLSGPTL